MRRSPLQTMFASVKVESLANGQLRVTPKWLNVREYTEEDGGGPGLLRRLAGAERLERFLNAHLRRGGK